ncbi:bactofilin family protein [Neptuniibacter halophilus]|uniref:bactofilin family protein n=1 Tax=Neptuniibacter halophilus TaxID=651666 RepID=UPI002573D87D|nr:polymer-forming cytoskeletal protein [Neptuniibacter halophilus]
MGILKRNVSTKSAHSAITIIAEGNKFCGDMSIVGKMHIDGVFEGNISSLDNISIGKSGHVRGLVKARAVDVCGLLEGEVICDELHIDSGGQVRATVESKQMSIHPQGCFLGERRLKEISALGNDGGKIETGLDAIDSLPDKVVLDGKSD